MRTLCNDQWQKIRDFLEGCPDVYLGTEADSRRFTSWGVETVMLPHPRRKAPAGYDLHRYQERHLVACFINKIK
jgi:hypothetical protein